MFYSLSPRCTVLGKVIQKPERSFSFLAYLVKGAGNVLIDTVPQRSAELFLQELEGQVPLTGLDALILNHSEQDHSGALGALLARRPDLPIYCTPACQVRLAAEHPNARFRPVEHGATLTLGEHTFRFFHTPGLHWEDNMVTLLEGEDILFSNDLFGQYLGAEPPLDTGYAPEQLLEGAETYFTAVFRSATAQERQVVGTILAQPIRAIAPGHGVILEQGLDVVTTLYRRACVPSL